LGSLFVFSPAHADLNTGLVANYSFDDCTAKDVSGNGHDGTINGNPQCVDGIKGKAFKLNGISDWILVDNSNDFPENEISISYWIKQDNLPDNLSNYISKELAFQSYLLNDGDFQSGTWKGAAGQWRGYSSGNYKYKVNNWVLYTWTFSNATKQSKTFIDGKLVDEVIENDANAYLRKSSYPMYIGRNGSANVYHVNGAMDDVRIYNRTLSETEIKSLYNMGQLSGTVNGVQKYSAVCKNLKTGVSKKIALADGAKEWNCTAAGVKAKKGESVMVTITGVSQ
jgi:hypothetical protein